MTERDGPTVTSSLSGLRLDERNLISSAVEPKEFSTGPVGALPPLVPAHARDPTSELLDSTVAAIESNAAAFNHVRKLSISVRRKPIPPVSPAPGYEDIFSRTDVPPKAVNVDVEAVLERVKPLLSNELGKPIIERDPRVGISDVLERCSNEAEYGSALYAVDLGRVVSKYVEWCKEMPRIMPFYAVKCNPDPMVIRTLAICGAGFDCASKAEIEAVLAANVPTGRILFANPCKAPPQIRYSKSIGVSSMTFDNKDELIKIKKLYPTARLVLRLYTDDEHSVCPLGAKFGAQREDVPDLLQTAKELELDVIGVSFHVGSGCYDAAAYTEAVKLAHDVFGIAKEMGLDFYILDIGGGFPGTDEEDGITFKEIASKVAPLIDELFPPNVTVIAEPGRYFVSASFTLAVSVLSRRALDKDGREVSDSGMTTPCSSATDLSSPQQVVTKPASKSPSLYEYTVNESVYGSFRDRLLLDCVFVPHVLTAKGDDTTYDSILVGHTGADLDVISRDIKLPRLSVGDWLYFTTMGAYTVSLCSNFNGSNSHLLFYYWATL